MAQPPREDYYQVLIQVTGADADILLFDSPAEPDKIVECPSAGATVNLKMRALDETGPRAFGDSVQVVMT